jgi:hypothetical protein
MVHHFVHLKVGLAFEALGLNDLTGKTKPHVPKKKFILFQIRH